MVLEVVEPKFVFSSHHYCLTRAFTLNLNDPTGGLAYGIPKNLKNSTPSRFIPVVPKILPCFTTTVVILVDNLTCNFEEKT